MKAQISKPSDSLAQRVLAVFNRRTGSKHDRLTRDTVDAVYSALEDRKAAKDAATEARNAEEALYASLYGPPASPAGMSPAEEALYRQMYPSPPKG